MSALTKSFLKSISLGADLVITDNEDGDFQGKFHSITFHDTTGKNWKITLEQCHKVGTNKKYPGLFDFDSGMTKLHIMQP